jgi:hypothetical protein
LAPEETYEPAEVFHVTMYENDEEKMMIQMKN